jgi:hypothetical protein
VYETRRLKLITKILIPSDIFDVLNHGNYIYFSFKSDIYKYNINNNYQLLSIIHDQLHSFLPINEHFLLSYNSYIFNVHSNE